MVALRFPKTILLLGLNFMFSVVKLCLIDSIEVAIPLLFQANQDFNRKSTLGFLKKIHPHNRTSNEAFSEPFCLLLMIPWIYLELIKINDLIYTSCALNLGFPI